MCEIDMHDFNGKVAFITGGGSGIALGQAKVFSRAGAKVVIADIREDHLEQAMKYFRRTDGEVHPIVLDVTDRAAFVAAADETERVFGPVQLLFNTAGVSIFGPLEKSTYDDYDYLDALPSEYLRSNVFITSSGVAWEPAILFAQQVLGVSQVMYAMDYPYQAKVSEVAASDHFDMDDAAKMAFFQTNAERVFHLN